MKLEHVMPAVRSTSFIAERLATDDLSARPAMRAAYEAENQGTFATYGITNMPNKQLFGGESMFPKLAYAFNSMLPYVCGMEPMDRPEAGELRRSALPALPEDRVGPRHRRR